MSERNVNLTWSPTQVTRVLMFVILGTVIAHVGALVSIFWFGHDVLLGLVPLFDLDKEQNIPTLFATLMLAAIGVLFLAVRGTEEGRGRWVWMALAVLFFFFAVDEFGMVHEHLGAPLRAALDTGGIFYWAWVIPYGVVVLAVTVMFIPMFIRLPRDIRSWLAAAAILYVTGALGLEFIEGSFAEQQGTTSLTYAVVAALQEILEMIGLVFAIHGLSLLILLRTAGGRVSITPEQAVVNVDAEPPPN